MESRIQVEEAQILGYLQKKLIARSCPATETFIKEAVEDSYKRLIAPAIEREIRAQLTEEAQEDAMKVFGKNLEQLLMQPPIANQVVLGWLFVHIFHSSL